ncbi:MAG: flagellar motor protein MotB [Parvularculaceae bacterium]|nr:flagellar motor protein MotB [Parvularculaceae bacterium]
MRAPAASNRRRNAAWIITYADLMTLLVCFFVLIVSFSVQDRAKMQVVTGSIREAFGVTKERRYAGDVTLTGAKEARQPASIIETEAPSGQGLTPSLSSRPAAGAEGVRGNFEFAPADQRRFEAAKERLEHAILLNPVTRGLDDAITITLTESGLQIIIVDRDGAAMFASGSAQPTREASALIAETARALQPLPNRIFVEAHADATGAGTYSPFELTAARANAARAIMEEAGLRADRIAGVTGKGEAFPLYPENPFAPGNRRIEITLEAAAPLLPERRPL